MSKYDCYFDASHRPTMSCCAFCVKMDDQIIHTDIYHERIGTAHKAEMRALYMLLQYIQQQIEPGSAVVIYGDDQSLIRQMKGRTRRRIRNKTKKLFILLQHNYNLKLTYIPRSRNKTAHKLTETVYEPKASVQSKTMLLSEIIIPDCIRDSQPNDLKYQRRLLYYRKHGEVYKNIQVNSGGILLDGYISYLILKENGVSECLVDVLLKKPEETVLSSACDWFFIFGDQPY